ncbi:tryptophan 2,3-dioxygenase family protein [Motiliproteus sp. SC1-56]|uniref:tryptophan 2,3-dioxygenase family protein n=1 Tax=Motiliproteus sp. SC1-56 TaxID=2799565 RepID=UPI001A8FD21F|nr:tryptophan 2,3-dioxygenase family protein [Motiliproteus sp. SC1-56]
MSNIPADTDYGAYLQLEKILGAQAPARPEAHDETLFIIVHQAYELWFKEILHELDSIQRLFDSDALQERALGTVESRLERISAIERLLVEQVRVLETMTPLDFLDFRDVLSSPRGFQSVQFREIELRLGVRRAAPGLLESCSFFRALKPADRDHLKSLEGQDSLFTGVESWLARMPFLHYGDYDFWRDYLKATAAMLNDDLSALEGDGGLSPAEQRAHVRELSETIARFDGLFDSVRYAQLRADNKVRFSQEAMLAALFIQLYRDEPVLQQPFRVLNRLVAVDEGLCTWRYQNTLMIKRLLGRCNNGLSGAASTRLGPEPPRVFEDLFSLASFLLPRSRLPTLPDALRRDLDFHFSGRGDWGG